MSLSSRLFAAMYDRMSARSEEAGLGTIRHDLLAGAGGRVLEIGAGTGINLAHYRNGIDSLTITEPAPPMLKRLDRRAREQAPLARVLRASAEALPFEDGTFDTAVSTLVLCGVDDQAVALAELHRVLRPGGRLLFLEHVRSDDPALARRQDRMNRINRIVAHCDCNRPTLGSIEAAGFAVTSLQRGEIPKTPTFVRQMIFGAAVRPA
jgi:ubiquinone/menaquinone biosynthesis C-methylase UbiE